jgi:eukaryotic-like serine/threonine-protein kinase
MMGTKLIARPVPAPRRRRIGWFLVVAGLGIVAVLVVGVAIALSNLDVSLDVGRAAQTRFDPAAMSGRAVVWSAPVGAAMTSAPTVAAGSVYVRDQRGRVDAFNATTGRSRWAASSGPGSASGVDFAPVVAYGAVYVTGWDGVLYAFDSATGATRWTTDLGTSKGFLATGGYPLVVADGSVYVNVHGISAFDATTGRTRWTAPTGGAPLSDSGLTSYSMPVVANGVVYIGGDDAAVHAFDMTTGQPRWSSTPFPTPIRTGNNQSPSFSGIIGPTSSLTLAGSVVYAAGRDGQLHALDATSGVARWTVPIGNPNSFGSAPVVVNGSVYVETDALYALDAAAGSQRWVAQTGGVALYAFVPPVVNAGVVYLASGDGLLHEIDPATGAARWTGGRVPLAPKQQPSFGPAIAAIPPAITSDVLYVGSGDHRIYAYRLNRTR